MLSTLKDFIVFEIIKAYQVYPYMYLGAWIIISSSVVKKYHSVNCCKKSGVPCIRVLSSDMVNISDILSF